jgi:hypothetical protein
MTWPPDITKSGYSSALILPMIEGAARGRETVQSCSYSARGPAIDARSHVSRKSA